MQTFLRTAGFSNIDVHMVPGRQRLVEFGPLFYPEYVWYRLSARWGNLREILCAIAEKSSLVAGNGELRPAPGEFGI